MSQEPSPRWSSFVSRTSYVARRIWLDIRMGRCSGFPSCCICFYVTGWRLLFGDQFQSLSDKPTWRMKAILWYHRRSAHAGYVPCPLCLISKARVAEVRRCTEKCGHIRESQDLITRYFPEAKFVRDL